MGTVKGLAFGSGPRLGCIACGQRVELKLPVEAGESGLGGVMRAVKLDQRLSVWVFAVRRGAKLLYTQTAGQTAFYDCLVQLFLFWFHPSFVIVFLYFSTMVHLECKAARGKYATGLTPEGFQSRYLRNVSVILAHRRTKLKSVEEPSSER
jgi:hypothetical protein